MTMIFNAETRRPQSSAGFQTCCIADFQIGTRCELARFAGLETRDTADLEVCATAKAFPGKFLLRSLRSFAAEK